MRTGQAAGAISGSGIAKLLGDSTGAIGVLSYSGIAKALCLLRILLSSIELF